jgi:hypothetical protein
MIKSLVSVIGAHLFYFQLRAGYYTMMSIIEDDEEAQKRGVVGCPYFVDRGFDIDLQVVRKSTKLRNALPVRFDSVHVCYNDPWVIPFLSFAMIIMGTHSRIRFRAHYGSDEECRCQLSSFGIPISALPLSPRGEFNLENHWAFVSTQRAIEVTKSKGKGPIGVAEKAKKKPEEKARSRQPITKEDDFVAAPQPDLNEPNWYGRLMSFSDIGDLPQPSFANPWWGAVGAPNLPLVMLPPPERQLPVVPRTHIIGPTSASRPPAKLLCKSPAKLYVIYDPLPNDILLGRGKPVQNRPGNVRFREMLDKHFGKYDTAYIVHLVKEEGGRFLKELEDGGWVEVDEATARAKVNNAFRALRKLKKNKRTA